MNAHLTVVKNVDSIGSAGRCHVVLRRSTVLGVEWGSAGIFSLVPAVIHQDVSFVRASYGEEGTHGRKTVRRARQSEEQNDGTALTTA